MKALFLDADGTLWYVGNEEGDGFKQSSSMLIVDSNLETLLIELSERKIPLWIVSYNEPGTVERNLEHLNMAGKIPNDQVSCNWRDKGERIKEILSTNGIEKALFVGDRQSDYQASLAAGIEGRILKRRFNERYWHAGPMVSSLLSVLPLLDAL
ncbi:HAD family hydrolase [Candidatus Bathyarchaeota archaeon]|nr:HAD family hydrolase [Candidatus Bathyarchaeota archaeon]